MENPTSPPVYSWLSDLDAVLLAAFGRTSSEQIEAEDQVIGEEFCGD